MRATPVLILLMACDAPAGRPAAQDDAWAVIEPLTADGPRGVARFRDTPRGTRVIVLLEGLTAGAHGLHLRAGADCVEPGAHFAPEGGPHGGPLGGARHAGDLGNVVQHWQDETRYARVDPALTLEGPSSIVGHPIVVTDGPDDLVTDPDGTAGVPIACGVVTAVR